MIQLWKKFKTVEGFKATIYHNDHIQDSHRL